MSKVETFPARVEVQRLRCACGCVTQWRSGVKTGAGAWVHTYRCPKCGEMHIDPIRYPLVMLFHLDSTDNTPDAIIQAQDRYL